MIMASQATTWGNKGADYFEWQSAAGQFGARINAHKFQHLVKPPIDTVIYFGCGGGFLLAQLNCRQRFGVEVNPVARKYAETLGVRCFAGAEVPDGVADLIISDHALEHVLFPIGALSTPSKKLKPSGSLSICVPIDN